MGGISMDNGIDYIAFFSGLPLGIVITLIIWYFIWKKGKKERKYDERYYRIHDQARSMSWSVTTISIIIVWFVVFMVEGLGLAFYLMTGIWVMHMVSYLLGAAIASRKN
jgi:hypothetical protein